MSKSQIATGGIADDAVSTAKVLNDSRIVTPLIINGDMAVAQRGTSATDLGASSGYNTCDRWNLEKEGSPSARFTQSQDTDVPTGQGFTTSLKMDCTTAAGSPDADDAISIQQKIEAQNLQLLRYGTSSAKKVTLSFWVKATKTGTNAIWIYQNDDNRSQAQTYTVNTTNTWEKKTVVFAADTTGVIDNNNGEGFRISWWLTAGSNFTSGTLATTWQSHTAANNAVGQVNNADSTDNNWYITGVQMEIGEFDTNTIPPFPFESRDSNLRRCKRYFQIYMDASESLKDLIGGHIHDNDTFRMTMLWPVEFRATPSLSSSSSGSADHWRVITSSINTNYGSAVTLGGTNKSGQFTLVDTGGTDMSSHVDDPGYMMNAVTSCYLKLDAEL